MEKVLDGVGVAHLWKKIEDQFTQVKVCTKMEYNSLTPDEKESETLWLIRPTPLPTTIAELYGVDLPPGAPSVQFNFNSMTVSMECTNETTIEAVVERISNAKYTAYFDKKKCRIIVEDSEGNPFELRVMFNFPTNTEWTYEPSYEVVNSPYFIYKGIKMTGNDDLTLSGVIVIYHGSVDEIPEGWHLCDGTEGTPDLSDKFIVIGESRESNGINLIIEQDYSFAYIMKL